MEEKKCLACNALIRGRSDKRFCDDGCRSSYNNKLNSAPNSFVKRINHTLARNRRILGELLGDEKMLKVSREKLLARGLHFNCFTSQLSTTKGQVYFFVYEFGYLSLENDQFLLVRQSLSRGA
ncbi:hypothetical protein [Sphingobacterium sp. LRF_L2]|uniref:hypothetical protein n=1 Tax=Sphingobacterium sp. LRF_L2 TaxID=3369421 RepID=UPI003F616D55